MRKTLATLIAFAALSGSAFAADMPLRKAPPPAPDYAADWTGFTVGLLGGGGWANAKPDVDIAPFSDPSGKGWVLGAYAGYNWQLGTALVVGVEGDYTQAALKDDQTVDGATIHTKVDRLASARARVGLLVTPNLLAYGTGGIGFGSGVINASFGEGTATARGNGWGWTAGGGLEYSLGAKLKLRAEYLHYDLGTVNFAASGLTSVNAATTVNVVRAGLGFQF
jgi:outer membrane immunogenic protein